MPEVRKPAERERVLKLFKVIRDGTVVKGNSKIFVQRGDNVMVPRKLNRHFGDWFNIILPITSLILTAKAAGLFNSE